MIQLRKRYVVATTLAALLLAILYLFELATGTFRQIWYEHEIKKRPQERTIRLPVLFPESSKRREVALRVTWKVCSNSVSTHWCIQHALVFDGGREQVTIQRPLYVNELPWRSFLALLEPKYSLRVAPDGHGLALSTDAGKNWQYIASDLEGPPIFFWQVTWDAGSGTPWPTTRDAALLALNPNDFSNGIARVPMEVVEQAQTAAAVYACSHQDDDVLVSALAWRWAHGGPIGDGPHTLQCMVKLANERAAVRRTLVEAIERYDEKHDPGGNDHDGVGHAADVLGRLDDSSSADALADRILALLPSEDRYPLERLTRALARLTLRTHVRSDKARHTLTSIALGEHNLGHDCASSGIIARIDAVRALADYRDDTTLKVLQTVAAGEPCVRTQVAWNDDIDTVRNPFCPEEIACWAGAAVAHAATPKQGTQLPEAVLRLIVGCWQLGHQEQWSIARTNSGGARVVRRLLNPNQVVSRDYATRAAIPSDIQYDPANGGLAFSTAGPVHALRFVFTAASQAIEGSWASSHAPSEPHHATGARVKLRPCALSGARPKGE